MPGPEQGAPGACWGGGGGHALEPPGSCSDRPASGAPVLSGEGDALGQGVRGKAGESVRTFLCQRHAEEEAALGGLDAFLWSSVQRRRYSALG